MGDLKIENKLKGLPVNDLNERLLSKKRPLYNVKIALDAPL